MMQVLKLPAAAGLLWIRAGFALMLQQFVSILTMVFTYLVVFVIAGYGADLVGDAAVAIGLDGPIFARMSSLAFAALSPILSIGFMEACRSATLSERITPLFLFKGFQLGRRELSSLLALGVFQVAALSVILSFLPPVSVLPLDTPATGAPATQPSQDTGATVPGAPVSPAAASSAASSAAVPTAPSAPASTTPSVEPTPSPSRGADGVAVASDANTPDALTMQALLGRMATLMAVLAVSVILWYAPMLAAWQGMRAVKAMFFSIAACWRNKGAFFVFGAGWLAVWFFAAMLFGVLVTIVGTNNVSLAFGAAMGLMLVGVMYCSVYITYASVFVRPGLPDPPLI